MSITYQYYCQGTTFILTYSTSATNISTLNYMALNHLAVTSTQDCYVLVTRSDGALVSTTTSGQFIMARTETIIPYVKGRSLSVIGTAAGTLYATEFLGA